MSFKILAVGDSCLDQFQYGVVKRTCPEAPCLVFNPTYKTENLGMAGNVVANLYALGDFEIDFMTNQTLPMKIRYVEERSNQMLMRQDINDEVLERFDIKKVIDKKYDAAVISDYDKGFIRESDMIVLSKCSNLTFLDTKKKLGDWATWFSFIKINEVEYENNKGCGWRNNLIVTKGDRGATYRGVDYPTNTPEQILDVSGAGDTFLAGLVYEYLKSRDIETAIHFANRCASKVVTKRGVSTI